MPIYINYLSGLSRRAKVFLQVILDAVLIIISFFCSNLLAARTDLVSSKATVLIVLAITVAASLFTFKIFGLYKALVRYITGKILFPVALGAFIAYLTLYIAGLFWKFNVQQSRLFVFGILVFFTVGGLRFLARAIFLNPIRSNRRPVIIYGAGDSGRQLLNSLFHSQDYSPIAFVDDDTSLHNLVVGGLRVYAPDEIAQLVRERAVEVILLAIPNASRARRRAIVRDAQDIEVRVKTIPGLSEIISGKAKISELRVVSAEDLLGRDPVAPDHELLSRNIFGRSVMVTGAGGSIGSELCRQIISQQPSMLILYEVSEFALYTIEAELAENVFEKKLAIKIIPILGSVQDSFRLEAAITAFSVQTIYHAAAYKHVPIVEENLIEGVRNNVFGTLSVSSSARKLGVKNFILISTDKAVRPTNVMGATKRLAELICQAHAQEKSSTVFSMVRFGNVLGSSGSVIPRFRKQIERGGPVTVTHRDITRYFMTISEAAQLVIQAGALGSGGDVFVLDMGEPVKIMELAITMVKLHGLTPYVVNDATEVNLDAGDIPICVTGLRKGEKLYEELLIGNAPLATRHPRIMTASEASLTMAELAPTLERLNLACYKNDLPEIISIFHELPLEYKPLSEDMSDLLWAASRNINACDDQSSADC